MDGVKYSPNLLGINCAAPSCQTAIKLLVVPRSIPIANVALSIAFNLSGKRVYRIKNTTLWRGDLYQCHAAKVFIHNVRQLRALAVIIDGEIEEKASACGVRFWASKRNASG